MKTKLQPAKLDGQSRVPHQELIELLRQKAPMIFTEDKIDPDKLKQLLGENVNGDSERYGLNWAGKSDCFRHIQEPTTATLRPVREESVDFDNTENIFIEGENLQVLKVLQKSYYGKIKMIYIDPPYNTGSDSFIYPDRFQESKEDYLLRVGDKDEAGNLTNEGMFRKNSRDNGHYHSNWLSMMYPRLFLARNLLREDGAIFVSIDYNEEPRLRIIMDEIFGADNYRNTFIVSRVKKNIQEQELVKSINWGCNSVLFYAKSEKSLILPPTKSQNKPERWHSFDAPGIRKTMEYELFGNFPPQGRHWMFEENIAKEMTKNGELRANLKTGKPEYKLAASDYTLLDTNWTDLQESDSTWLKNGGKNPALLKRLLKMIPGNDFWVLDFFAGSGTTADATMSLNHQDLGSRKCLSIQLAESCEDNESYGDRFETIADIAKNRIITIGKQIRDKRIGKLDLDERTDTGLKIFKLDDSNFKIWRSDVYTEQELIKQMNIFINNVKEESAQENILYELMLKTGLHLNIKVEKKQVKDKKYFSLDDGKMIICLEDEISQAIVDAILNNKPEKVILLDKSFKSNDQLKTNALLQMESAKIDFKVI